MQFCGRDAFSYSSCGETGNLQDSALSGITAAGNYAAGENLPVEALDDHSLRSCSFVPAGQKGVYPDFSGCGTGGLYSHKDNGGKSFSY